MDQDARRRRGYLNNELKSLGIDAKKKNELNDDKELAALTENIKQTYFQDYKTAYGDKEVDESNFDYII
jgi:hypothetical protein